MICVFASKINNGKYLSLPPPCGAADGLEPLPHRGVGQEVDGGSRGGIPNLPEHGHLLQCDAELVHLGVNVGEDRADDGAQVGESHQEHQQHLPGTLLVLQLEEK